MTYKEINRLKDRGARCFVYFIGLADFVKIGASSEPCHRQSSLNMSVPYRCELLAVEPFGSRGDAFTAEARYHERFSMHRHKGEWFVFASSIHECVIVLNDRVEQMLRPPAAEAVERVYRPSYVAKVSGQSRYEVSRHIKKGVIAVRRIGPYRVPRIPESELQKYLQLLGRTEHHANCATVSGT